MLKKTILLSFVSIVLLLIGSYVYAFMISMSEDREYGKFGLDHFILTPTDLSNISEYCEDDPRFRYSSADGPKPSAVNLYCVLDQSSAETYLIKNDFDQVAEGQFERDALKIVLEKTDGDKIFLITSFEWS